MFLVEVVDEDFTEPAVKLNTPSRPVEAKSLYGDRRSDILLRGTLHRAESSDSRPDRGRASIVNDVVFRFIAERARHGVVHGDGSAVMDEGQCAHAGDLDRVHDGVALVLRVVRRYRENDVGDLLVGGRLGQLADVAQLHGDQLLDGPLSAIGTAESDGASGRFDDVCS